MISRCRIIESLFYSSQTVIEMLKQAPRIIARSKPIVPAVRTAIPSRALASVSTSNSYRQSQSSRSVLFGSVAAAGIVAAGLSWNVAQAEELQGPIFDASTVEVFAVIGEQSGSLHHVGDLMGMSYRPTTMRQSHNGTL